MAVIELDMLIGLVNSKDPLHNIASKFFDEVASGRYEKVYIASSAYLEYELVLRSRGLDLKTIYRDIESFRNIRNIDEAPLSSEVILKSIELRDRYSLTFFDSLHAATAIKLDGVIISTDKAYSRVKELKHIDPRTLFKEEP